MKDIKPLLLVLLSIGLVGTWVYHLYDKSVYSRQGTGNNASDSIAIANAVRDSLNRYYSSTIDDLDTRLASSKTNADSLQNSLTAKLLEISQLRTEILQIVSKQHVSKSELVVANEKMVQLQQKVGELQAENQTMEEEKKEFNTVLQQLTQNVDSLRQHVSSLSGENQQLHSKVNLASVFVASDIRLSAVNLRSSGEEPTFQVKKADKFVVSLIVQNHVSDYNNAEIAIVVIQPDKQVMQNAKWDSGSFDTKSDGQKKYTRLVKFDYTRDERRDLTFSLDADEFQKGNYILQIWHKGILIGQSVTGLN